MSRLFLLRLSFLSIKQLVNSKVNIIINLSIFVIVFALSASFISILFENRIEKLETKITRNEVNQILYTKWLNRTPKIINQIDNVYRNRKDEILFQLMITALPDDDNDNYTDTDETAAGTNPLLSTSVPADLDGDFISDATDTDI